MNLHKNARTTPHSRLLMVRRVLNEKQSATKVAADFGVSERTVRKWLARWRAGGEPALTDRSWAPARQRRLPLERVAAIAALRRQRLTSPVIARRLGLPLSTVGGVLRRLGLGRLKRLDPPAPVVRYQRERPGELVHIDTKKLGKIAGIGHRITGRRSGMVNRHRGIGWEYLHVAVDDASRLAYTEILPDERKASAIAFLERALAWFMRHGVSVERIMTDIRQRLSQPRLPRCLRQRGCAPSAHPALHAQDQRQGRAVPPDGHARMRLRPRLPIVTGACRRAAPLAAPLQRAPAAHRPRRTTPDQPTRHEQPAW